jgi:hypothetical protein
MQTNRKPITEDLCASTSEDPSVGLRVSRSHGLTILPGKKSNHFFAFLGGLLIFVGEKNRCNPFWKEKAEGFCKKEKLK